MNSHTTSQVHMHKHLCWIGRGTHIRGTQHDNKLQHRHTQQDINGTVITCVHTCHLWDSHVFTLFVRGMQRIHKHKKVGCALTESLVIPLLSKSFSSAGVTSTVKPKLAQGYARGPAKAAGPTVIPNKEFP